MHRRMDGRGACFAVSKGARIGAGGGTVELERRASAQGMLAHLGFPEDWAAQMDYAGGGRVVFATRRR